MTYKLGKYFAAALSLLLLAACSQDKDIVQQGSTNDEPPIQMLANFEADFEGFQTASAETKDERQQARSFSTPKGVRGDVQIIVEDGMSYILTDERKPSSVKSKWAHINRNSQGKKGTEKMKMLLVIRSKADTTDVAVTPLEWDYYDNTVPVTVGGQLIPQPRYRIVNQEVNVPASAKNGGAIEARVLAGGYYDKDDKKIRVPAGMTEVIDLGGKNNAMVPMPIPFISPWYDVQADPNKTLQFSRNTFATEGSDRIKDSQNYFRLKPLGTLVTTTLRNTSDQDVTIDGIDIQTNALHLGEVEIDPATFSVSGDMTHNNAVKGIKISNAPDLAAGVAPKAGELGKYTMPESGDIFYRMAIKGPEGGIKLKKQAKDAYKVSDIIFVTWGMPVDGKHIGNARVISDKNKNTREDLNDNFSYAQTQIYARGVKANDKPVTRPNYSIVPIMGTDYNLLSGRSYTLNAELFEQPNVLLGYYAKYPIGLDAKSFATTHDRDDIGYINYYKAREFAKDGVSLPIPSKDTDPTIPTEATTAVYKIAPTSAYSIIGLNAGPAIATHTGGGSVTYGQYVSQAWQTGIRTEVAGVRHLANGTISFGSNDLGDASNKIGSGRMYAHRTSDFKIAYGISNKDITYGANLNRANQADQTLWRYELVNASNREAVNNAIGSTPIQDLEVQAIFIGKYFVGNSFSPIYNGANLLDESALWNKPEATINKVERHFTTPGVYNTGVTSGQPESNELWPFGVNVRPPGNQKAYSSYWGIANGYAQNRLLYWWVMGMYTSETSEQLINRAIIPPIDPRSTDADGRNEMSDGSYVYRYNSISLNSGWSGVAASAGGLSSSGALQADYMRTRLYMPLLPVSTTYQGDSKD